MLPVSKSFGLGNSNGVENDISLNHWSIVGSNGISSDNNYPYLKSGEPVNVEVNIGFEGSESHRHEQDKYWLDWLEGK